MRDKSHQEQVERWALRCRQDMKGCLAETALLVNAQLEMANSFYKRLAAAPNGAEKIRALRRIGARAGKG